MLATAQMISPTLLVVVIIAPPNLAAIAAFKTPTVSVAPPAIAATTMLANAAMAAPVVKIDAPVAAAVMAATAALRAPTISAGVSTTATLMHATALMLSPSVGTSEAISAPLLLAAAQMLAPTISAGAAVTAALMPAIAAMLAPTVLVGVPINAVPMLATAAMLGPTIGAGLGITAALMQAAAAALTPTVGMGATITAPLIQASAAMLAPTISTGPPPASITGANSSATTTVTLPAHNVGDIIIIWTVTNAASPPTKPAASGTVPTWIDIDPSVVQGSNPAARSAYAVATATNHTSGTWTSAVGMIAVVVTGENSAAPIGAHLTGSGTDASQNSIAPAVTMLKTDGSSALLHFFARRPNVSAWAAAPTGYTQQTANVSGAVCLDSKNDTTSDGSVTQGSTATSNQYVSDTIEVIAAATPNTMLKSSAAGATVTIPAYNVGDTIVIFAVNTSGATAVSIPAGSGTVPTWTQIDRASGSNLAVTTAYFVGTSTVYTSTGTFTNATAYIVVVVASGKSGGPIGGHSTAGNSGVSATPTSPSITMTNTDGSSTLLYFFATSSTTAFGAASTGYTLQASATHVALDSKNDDTSDGSTTHATGDLNIVTNGTAVVEIVAH